MGYFIVFQAEQYAIKKEMKNNIELGIVDERVSVITVSNEPGETNNDFLLNGDEFIYKGKQYDILRKQTNHSSTTFYAVNDTKEDHLISSLEDHLEKNTDLQKSKSHSAVPHNFIKNIFQLYYSDSPLASIVIPSSNVSYHSTEVVYFSADKKELLLPPELA